MTRCYDVNQYANTIALEKFVCKILLLGRSLQGCYTGIKETIIAYAKVALKGKESKPITLFLAKEKLVINLLRLHGCRIDEPEGRVYEAWFKFWNICYILQLGLGPDHLPQVFVCDQLVIIVSEREVGRGLLYLEIRDKLFHDVCHRQGWIDPDFYDAILSSNAVCGYQCFGRSTVGSGTRTEGVSETICVRGHVTEPSCEFVNPCELVSFPERPASPPLSLPIPGRVALSTMATPSVSQQTDILNSIFLGLRSKVSETRLQSALDLRRYVCHSPVPDASLPCSKVPS
jgi:hypothetical protein